MVTEEETYLGFVEGVVEDKNFKIVASTKDKSFDELKIGVPFYLVMFNLIFETVKPLEILSDKEISEAAFNSYTKLETKYSKNLIVKVKTIDGEYLEFTKDNFLISGSKISIKAKYTGEILEDYYKRFSSFSNYGHKMVSSHYTNMYNARSPEIDQYLFF